MKRDLVSGLLMIGLCGAVIAQEKSDRLQGRTAASLMHARGTNPGPTNSNWKSNNLVTSAMSHSVVTGPTGTVPGGTATSALVAVLRKQSTAAQALLVPAVRPLSTNGNGPLLSGGTSQMLKPPANSSSPQIGATHIMNSPGSGGGASNGHTVPPTIQQVPSAVVQGHPQQPQKPGAQVIPTQVCMAGIATVDGQKSGVWFSPVSGPDGIFVIQGCGFGATPGVVYLTGVPVGPPPATAGNKAISVQNQVTFQVAPNQWSDRQIVAQIDPNASGFYDSNNVTLVVKTVGGQQYQAAGFNFSAARADQVLNWIVPPPNGSSSFVMSTAFVTNPTAVVHLAAVTDSSGNLMLPTVSSPSAGTIWSSETVGAIRAKLGPSTPSKVTFPGGTDSYQLNLAPGFQLDPHTGVQMRHTQIDVTQCQQSFNGDYLSSGNWAVSYSSKNAFQISWQEQSCWPKVGTQGVSPLDYGSVSVYALQVTVLGPRGVSPWASGNMNPLTIKQGTQQRLLLGN